MTRKVHAFPPDVQYGFTFFSSGLILTYPENFDLENWARRNEIYETPDSTYEPKFRSWTLT